MHRGRVAIDSQGRRDALYHVPEWGRIAELAQMITPSPGLREGPAAVRLARRVPWEQKPAMAALPDNAARPVLCRGAQYGNPYRNLQSGARKGALVAPVSFC